MGDASDDPWKSLPDFCFLFSITFHYVKQTHQLCLLRHMEENWANYLKNHCDFSVNVIKEKVGNGAWIIQGVYFHWSKAQNSYLISLRLTTLKFMTDFILGYRERAVWWNYIKTDIAESCPLKFPFIKWKNTSIKSELFKVWVRLVRMN